MVCIAREITPPSSVLLFSWYSNDYDNNNNVARVYSRYIVRSVDVESTHERAQKMDDIELVEVSQE